MTTPIEPRLTRPINYISRMFSGSDLTGSSSRKVGDIEVANGDGFYDEMIRDYIWEGRSVDVYVGGKDMNFVDFKKIMVTKIKDITWNNDVINIKVHDNKKQFTDNIQPDKYLGTGGNEGGEELKDVHKPLLYGRCLNVAPILIDSVNQVYQVHNGPIANLVVRFAGLSVIKDVGYTLDKETGTFELLTQPFGLVTCSVQGAAGVAGHAQTTASIIIRIIQDNSDMVWPDDFNVASFKVLERSNTAVTGVYIPSGNKSLKNILDDLMEAVNGYWFFDRLDKLHVGILGISGVIPRYTNNEIYNISRQVTSIPVWSVTVSYYRNHKVMNESELAGAVTSTERNFLLSEYRSVNESDTNVQDVHTDHEQQIDTNLWLLTDAQYQAERRLKLFGVERDIYKIEIPFIDYSFQIGQGITISHNRFGLDGGDIFLITAIQENTRTNMTVLELWG